MAQIGELHAGLEKISEPSNDWNKSLHLSPPKVPHPKTKGLRRNRRKPLILMARLAGFEPTTPWFVAKYSIQLSYSR